MCRKTFYFLISDTSDRKSLKLNAWIVATHVACAVGQIVYKRIGSVAALGRTPIVGVGAESVASSVVAGGTASSVVAGGNGRKARGVVGGGIVAHGVSAATTVPPCLGGQCLGYTISPRCINCTAAARTLVSVIIDVSR